MKPTLQIHQSQQLRLTPQLRQAIHLLQLSTAELEQEVERIVEQNPFLERLESPRYDMVRMHADGSLRHELPPAPVLNTSGNANLDPLHSWSDADAPAYAKDSTGVSPEPLAETDEPIADSPWDIGSPLSSPAGGDDDADPYGNALVSGQSLHEYLLDQLAEIRCDAHQQALIHLLIWEVQANGYLPADFSLQNLGDELQQNHLTQGNTTLTDLATALQTLQSFDPPGVAARSPGECLRLQIERLQQEQPAPAASLSGNPIPLALKLSQDDCLPLLARREDVRLCRQLHCSPRELSAARALIQSLDPHPGNRFGSEPTGYVIPDLIARRTSHGWRAEPNPASRLALRVHDEYEILLKNYQKTGPISAHPPQTGAEWAHSNTEDTHDETPSASPGTQLLQQLQEARTLVRNLQQRGNTIVQVAQAIIDRQKPFFHHGPEMLRPLVLRDIAEEIGRHESTVSRATNQKYIRTPFGTFELKYFFGSQLATDNGGVAASTAVCAHIQKLIEQEDNQHPLSDSRITELLGQKGIMVARRTVAKYRESLRILPAAQRRSR